MFSAIAAALAALALGHPAPAPITCASVQAWPDAIAADLGPNTRAYTWFDRGRPTRTVLGPQACGYLILLAVDPNDRAGSRLNGAGTRALEAQAALSFLHELEHQDRATRDERTAECSALELLPRFLEELAVRRPAPLLADARAFHRSKPAAYQC